MNPNLVLTDDQKKVRFRKMFEKKGNGVEVNGGGGNAGKPLPAAASPSPSSTSRDLVIS